GGFLFDTPRPKTVVSLVENIAEPQADIERERRRLYPQLRLIDGVERIADSRIQRNPVVRPDAITHLRSEESAEIHRTIGRIGTARHGSISHLITFTAYRVLKEQIGSYPGVE